MRMHRWIPVFTLAAALSAGACSRDNGGEAKLDSNDGIAPAAGNATDEGRTSGGSETAQERTTVVNDTAPHRPGAPNNPATGHTP
ncbi:hypothetical protein [Longimicrobium terrae]|uniref:Lipoprotein n=1 Tax=Longimicrobium terrae TaxID=1639882 RepID=A0A841H6U7_9BACT|nr:hypothetical protein [Longimicrobium terrae]MBB4638209.1 hypothetical protein [Longimicrobium terrae]MBB6073632.1 hypothetical protein [Longimicrobium terrae]NNC30312.1 hypothetical protein [Longimicrobium terrae]